MEEYKNTEDYQKSREIGQNLAKRAESALSLVQSDKQQLGKKRKASNGASTSTLRESTRSNHKRRKVVNIQTSTTNSQNNDHLISYSPRQAAKKAQENISHQVRIETQGLDRARREEREKRKWIYEGSPKPQQAQNHEVVYIVGDNVGGEETIIASNSHFISEKLNQTNQSISSRRKQRGDKRKKDQTDSEEHELSDSEQADQLLFVECKETQNSSQSNEQVTSNTEDSSSESSDDNSDENSGESSSSNSDVSERSQKRQRQAYNSDERVSSPIIIRFNKALLKEAENQAQARKLEQQSFNQDTNPVSELGTESEVSRTSEKIDLTLIVEPSSIAEDAALNILSNIQPIEKALQNEGEKEQDDYKNKVIFVDIEQGNFTQLKWDIARGKIENPKAMILAIKHKIKEIESAINIKKAERRIHKNLSTRICFFSESYQMTEEGSLKLYSEMSTDFNARKKEVKELEQQIKNYQNALDMLTNKYHAGTKGEEREQEKSEEKERYDNNNKAICAGIEQGNFTQLNWDIAKGKIKNPNTMILAIKHKIKEIESSINIKKTERRIYKNLSDQILLFSENYQMTEEGSKKLYSEMSDDFNSRKKEVKELKEQIKNYQKALEMLTNKCSPDTDENAPGVNVHLKKYS